MSETVSMMAKIVNSIVALISTVVYIVPLPSCFYWKRLKNCRIRQCTMQHPLADGHGVIRKCCVS